MIVLELSLIQQNKIKKIKNWRKNGGKNSNGGRLGVEVTVGAISRRVGVFLVQCDWDKGWRLRCRARWHFSGAVRLEWGYVTGVMEVVVRVNVEVRVNVAISRGWNGGGCAMWWRSRCCTAGVMEVARWQFRGVVEVADGVWWQRDECVREVILRRMGAGQNRRERRTRDNIFQKNLLFNDGSSITIFIS